MSNEAIFNAYYTALSIWRVPLTFVILISFETKSPEPSATAANELAVIPIANQIEEKKRARTLVSELLTQNLSKLQEWIEGSKEVVNTYREESGLIDKIGTELIGQRLSEQMTQLIEARAVAQADRARMAEIEELEEDGKFKELLNLIDSPSAWAKWDSVREAERQLAEISQDFGPNHPMIVQLEEELRDLYVGFQGEVRTAEQALRVEGGGAMQKAAGLQESTLELRRSMIDFSEKGNELRQLDADADAQIVGRRYDPAVLAIKWSSTSRRLVRRSVSRVSTRGMPLASCVLTQGAKSAHRVGTYQYLDYS